MTILKLIKIEWFKTFSKTRTYISFAAIFVVLALTFIGIIYDSGDFIEKTPTFNFLNSNFIIKGNIVNGYFISQLIMYFLMVHIPFLIALVAGDIVAGESNAGTFRIMLIRPPSRFQILISKAIVSLLYSMLLIAFMGILSICFGVLIFGVGDLLVVSKGFLIISRHDVFFRFLLAYPLAMISMMVVASLAFLFSVLVENAIGPIVGTMAVVVISVIITETPITLFQKIRPFLFTTYSKVWEFSFLQPIPVNSIITSVLYLFVFMFIFFAIAFIIFMRKDILS